MGLLAFCVCSEVIVMGKYWTGLSECQKIWWVQAYVVVIISLPSAIQWEGLVPHTKASYAPAALLN